MTILGEVSWGLFMGVYGVPAWKGVAGFWMAIGDGGIGTEGGGFGVAVSPGVLGPPLPTERGFGEAAAALPGVGATWGQGE